MHINLFFYYKCEPADALSTGYYITVQTCHYSDQCGLPIDEGSTWSAVGKPHPTSELNTPVHHVGNQQHVSEVTGQLADTPTRGLPTRGLDISRTGQLAD